MISAFRFEEEGLCPQKPGKLFTKKESMGEGVRPHYHSSLEINILEDLRGTVRMEGTQYPLEGEKVLFIPPGTVHSYDIWPESRRIHIIHLAFRMMRNWINPETMGATLDCTAPFCQGDTDGKALIKGLMEIIQPMRQSGLLKPSATMDPLKGPLAGKPIYLNPISSSQMLFFLLPFFSQREESSPIQLQKREKVGLRKLIDYAEEHYSSPIPVATAARICGMSRSSFCRFFPAATGSSWNRYLTDLRLDRGLKLLQMDTTVTEAALACGFYDSSHFNRRFQQRFGANPGSFKR